MAGRDRIVITNLRLPSGMKMVVERYQNRRNLPSFNRAVIELLETHPEIQKMVAELLDVPVT